MGVDSILILIQPPGNRGQARESSPPPPRGSESCTAAARLGSWEGRRTPARSPAAPEPPRNPPKPVIQLCGRRRRPAASGRARAPRPAGEDKYQFIGRLSWI